MRRVIALFLLVVLVFCAACSPETVTPAETTTTNPSTTVATTNETDLLYSVADKPYIQSVTINFKGARSAALNGNFLYVSVFDPDDDDYPDKLISYNIVTKQERILFKVESTGAESDTIENVQTDGEWIVWSVWQYMGSLNSIYMMNVVSGEITRVKAKDRYKPYNSAPVYDDGKIFWKEVVGSTSTVYQYNCSEKTKTVISRVSGIDGGNTGISANDGKVAWFDCIDSNGTYYIFDVETKTTETVYSGSTVSKDITYSGNKIYSVESENAVCLDLQSKTYRSLNVSREQLCVIGDFIVTRVGSVTHFYTYKDTELTEQEDLVRYYVSSVNICEDNTIITIAENEGNHIKPYKGLENKLTLHIYRFNEFE